MVLYQSCGPQAVTVKWSRRLLDSDFDFDAAKGPRERYRDRVCVYVCALFVSPW